MSEPVDQTRLAIAAIAAAFAKAIEERNPGFVAILKTKLSDAYHVVREGTMDNIGAMETLKWVGELLDKQP